MSLLISISIEISIFSNIDYPYSLSIYRTPLRGTGEYEVGEIDGPVGWCKLTIFEARLSDAGVYKIVFPFEPARYNQEITVKVNQIGLNQAEAISWLAIGLLAVLLVIQLLVGILIFGLIRKLRKVSEAQNQKGERRIPLMEQMRS